MTRAWLFLPCAALLACPGGEPRPECEGAACEQPAADAGSDAGAPDAGQDAGPADAGFDAGAPDAGFDAGVPDAGPDAGTSDGGCATPDAGFPPNLLANPGFECGDPPAGWVASPSGTLDVESAGPRSGLRAARVTADDGGVAVSLFAQTPTPNAGIHTYCARAWVRGAPPGGVARISLRMLTAAGGMLDHTFSAPLTAGYTRLEVSAPTQAQDDRVLFRVWMPAPAKGDALVVDDADEWVSPDGGCPER